MNRAFSDDLDRFLNELQADTALLEPDRLRARLDALEELDALIPASRAMRIDSQYARAVALREKLETANEAVYETIRHEVRTGSGARCLRQWIEHCAHPGPSRPGLGYDHHDELIAGVFVLHEPATHSVLAPDMVFYQPTPARHILEMICASGLGAHDVLIDLGSGLGHVPMLASILTGARAVGIEIDPACVRSAQDCAQSLGLNRVTFFAEDARDADLSAGTVFHLYTPFTGSMLRTVLARLRREGESREIRMCTLGPCAPVVAAEPWLIAGTAVDPERITCFRSRATSRLNCLSSALAF